jgi:hypothetical protein
MTKSLYSLIIIVLCAAQTVCAIDFETFKNNVTNDIEQQKDMPHLHSIWNKMLSGGFVDIGGGTQSNKDHVVKIQAIIEHHLSKLPALDSEAYIITPYPPTPLRLIGTGNPFCADGQTLCSSFFRTSTLRQYIAAGHPIELIYSNIGDDIPGIKFYKSFLHNNQNITARLVNLVPDHVIGATYYFKLDDAKCVFSVRGNQADTATQNDWGIWFGDQDLEVNLARTKEIFEYVKPFNK